MNTKKAILAGGCFWGVEALFRKLPGVVDTEVGYAGGTAANPTYDQLKAGQSDHAESIEITYNPEQISYHDLLQFFFQIHDPTTQDRQGNDLGTQYRSAIMTTDKDEICIAKELIAMIDASGIWPGKVVTEIIETDEFHAGEDYHQDYLEKHPDGYTCHFVRPEWTLKNKAS